MKKFFLDKIAFRIFNPVIVGTILYALILTLFNDISILFEAFLSKELFFCIALTYITQEISLGIFKAAHKLEIKNILLILIAIAVVASVVSFLLNLYYRQFNGYSPARFEYIIFIAVFSLLSLFLISLKISFNYLNKRNQDHLAQENLLKEDIERDFRQFKNGINPKLLFSSLESLIILSKNNIEEADKLIDQLSTVYRYILSKRKRELIECSEEINIARELIKLFNHLPYATIEFECEEEVDTLIVPGALLFLIELIIKKSIKTKLSTTKIVLREEENEIILSFVYSAKLGDELTSLDFKMINASYQFYSDQSIQLEKSIDNNYISIPKLKYHTSH